MASGFGLVLANNIGAGNGAAQTIPGGRFIFMANATWGGGNIKLQMQSSDGSTWVDVPSSTISANNMLTVELPPGQLRYVITTAAGVYATLSSVPTR